MERDGVNATKTESRVLCKNLTKLHLKNRIFNDFFDFEFDIRHKKHKEKATSSINLTNLMQRLKFCYKCSFSYKN